MSDHPGPTAAGWKPAYFFLGARGGLGGFIFLVFFAVLFLAAIGRLLSSLSFR